MRHVAKPYIAHFHCLMIPSDSRSCFQEVEILAKAHPLARVSFNTKGRFPREQDFAVSFKDQHLNGGLFAQTTVPQNLAHVGAILSS